eukprot:500885-Karenia_brevis.AAC.1
MWHLPQSARDHHMCIHNGHVCPLVLTSPAFEGEPCHNSSYGNKSSKGDVDQQSSMSPSRSNPCRPIGNFVSPPRNPEKTSPAKIEKLFPEPLLKCNSINGTQ